MVDTYTPNEALNLAVDKLGSQSELARICHVSRTAVWKWTQSSKRLPAEHVLTVEAETGISRHVLRPDIYPRDYPAAPDARFIGVDKHAARSLHYADSDHLASGTFRARSPSPAGDCQ